MYPTLIIIMCALDKSLHEKSHNDARMSAPRFAAALGRAHLTGLSSVSSDAHADSGAHEAPSEVMKEHAQVGTGHTASLSLVGSSYDASLDKSSYIVHGRNTSC